MICKKFPPFCGLSFHFIAPVKTGSSEAQKFLILMMSSLSFFFLLVLLMSHLRNHCLVQVHKDLLPSILKSLVVYFLHLRLTPILSYLLCMGKVRGFPGGSVVKNPLANAGDSGLILRSGRFPGQGNGNPLQYSCLENPMDRGAWQTTVHGIAKSCTWLNN